MALFAVDARDGVAQRVNDTYDSGDNVIRFFKIRADSASEAIGLAQSIAREARSGVCVAPWCKVTICREGL